MQDVDADAFADEFDGVAVAQLVRRDAPADAGALSEGRSVARTAAAESRRPVVGPSTTQKNGPRGRSACRDGRAVALPGLRGTRPAW